MELENLSSIPLDEIYAAQKHTKDKLLRTPLVPLNYCIEGKEVFLKLENLQTTGSFKVRGALNAVRCLSDEQLVHGVWTCSAGNFAQGLCRAAQIRGVMCHVIAPDTAPATKVAAIKELGGHVTLVPYDQWWNVMMSHKFEGAKGHFIHPVCDPMVIAGHGVMGVEILQDCPDVNTIIGPVGGGGHLCGIASAVKQLKPDVKVVACEVEGAAPLTASRAANKPVSLKSHKKTFVDGMGGKSVFPEMWSLLSHLVDDTVVLSLEEICEGVRVLLTQNKVLAEGAGGAPVAAAMRRNAKVCGDKIVCVISGGNMDMDVLQTILHKQIPKK